jgi:ABC-type multidrug transport system permease subunit
VIGIFNGFTFYNLSDSVASLQERFFTSFLILLIPPTIVNGVVPKFYMNRALWEAREYPSRIYGWFAFCTAQVVAEIPAAVVGSVIYWLLWYYPTNLPRDNETAGYMFLMTMLFYFFMSSWGQWICAFAPSFTVISNTLPFFFVVVSIFNGIVRPYSQLPVFWKYWMYYVNPSTWWLRGVLAATLKDIAVRCTQAESTLYNAPPGQTCQSYTQPFIQSSGMGYVSTLANGTCAYCPYADGNEYLATLNTKPNEQWRDFGIFLVFTISNWALVYFFIWSVRVKKWSFGMSYLFDRAEKMVESVKGLVRR